MNCIHFNENLDDKNSIKLFHFEENWYYITNKELVNDKDKELAEDQTSKQIAMTRNDLEAHMYENLLHSENQVKRSYLGQIKPYENKEITKEFDYHEVSLIASSLTNMNKLGKDYRKDKIDPNKGYSKFLQDN